MLPSKCFRSLLPLIPIFLLLVSCSSQKDSSKPNPPTVDTKPAQLTVIKMYQGISNEDPNTYLDSILPENRRVANPLTILSELSIGGSYGFASAGLDLGDLAKTTVHDLEVRGRAVNQDYVLVRAEGLLRLPALMMELPFCDIHDVRRVDGQWYVDIYATERQERLDRLYEKRTQNPSGSRESLGRPDMEEDPFSSMFGLLFTVPEDALNLCE